MQWTESLPVEKGEIGRLHGRSIDLDIKSLIEECRVCPGGRIDQPRRKSRRRKFLRYARAQVVDLDRRARLFGRLLCDPQFEIPILGIRGPLIDVDTHHEGVDKWAANAQNWDLEL